MSTNSTKQLAQPVTAEAGGDFLPSGAPNKQLYENSPLSGSSVEEEYLEDLDRFFNDKPPNLAIIHEKPEHRQMIYLKAQGYSNREIARVAGYTEAWVSQILRQPWARDRLKEELKHAGRDGVEAILEAAVEDSVWKVIELRDKAGKEETQLSAAKDLLDRYLGRPTQRVESLNRNLSVNLTGDLDEVNEQLKALEEEEKRLTDVL
jgi:hypothetical protein